MEKKDWTNSWRTNASMTTSHDGYILSPGSVALYLWIPDAGEICLPLLFCGLPRSSSCKKQNAGLHGALVCPCRAFLMALKWDLTISWRTHLPMATTVMVTCHLRFQRTCLLMPEAGKQHWRREKPSSPTCALPRGSEKGLGPVPVRLFVLAVN